MDYDIVFESDRINYVKVTEKLVDDYLTMINDENVQKFISHDRKHYTYESELEWIKERLDNNDMIFSMIEKGTNEFIGNIEIMNIKDNIGEVGISITPNKQDKHFGQEALKRIIKYSDKELNLDGLELNVYSFNQRGIKCYENVGFVKAGPGKTYDDIHMVLKK